MKQTTLIFYGCNGDEAKARAAAIRAAGGNGRTRDAAMLSADIEPCDAVVILPCVTPFDRARIAAAYPDKTAIPPPPAPLPPPVNPLANLPGNWRKMEPARLRDLAMAATGRTPENKEQAVELIEQALAARK